MMIEKIGTPAMLEQMAEEAAELAQAALKLARVFQIAEGFRAFFHAGDTRRGKNESDGGIYRCAALRRRIKTGN